MHRDAAAVNAARVQAAAQGAHLGGIGFDGDDGELSSQRLRQRAVLQAQHEAVAAGCLGCFLNGRGLLRRAPRRC